MNILKHREEVENLLKERPHLRDNDDKLLANIWYKTLKLNNINPDEITAKNLLSYISQGVMPKTESIRRIRQKLQQEFPELRGKKYNKRHGLQKGVIKQLNETPEIKKGGRP